MLDRRVLLMLFLAPMLGGAAQNARAGGGPENVIVVVNSASWASMTVANHFIHLRQIPPTNVVYIDWTGGFEGIEGETFRRQILNVVLDAMEKRGLNGQIDYVVYSSDFPYTVDLTRDFVNAQFPDQLLPQCSLNSATYLWHMVYAKNTNVMDLFINHYMRSFVTPAATRRTAAPTHGFRSWYGWGIGGELIEAGGQPYMLSTMLAITSGRGNSVREAVNYLRASAPADGTFPKGTVYFTSTNNIRSEKRADQFTMAIDDLKSLGIASEVVKNDMPSGRDDVLGVMTGVQDFSWGRLRDKIVPGAICDNFTSFGGRMIEASTQTPLTEFLRHGAAGSSGTVVEPFAIAQKFASPNIFVHYARGCTLAEAYYQSVFGPAQLLIVGDPLCRPWANIPKVYISGVKPNAKISGTLAIKPSGKFPKPGKVDHFELYVDGRRMASAPDGESLHWDSTTDVDGYHELRVVAIDDTPIETQGRTIFPVFVDNRGGTAQITALPEKSVRWDETLKVHAKAPGKGEIYVLHNNRVMGKISGEEGDLAVNPRLLGLGPVTLNAIGVSPGGVRERVSVAPLQREIEPPRALPPLKDAPQALVPGLALRLPDKTVVPVQDTLDPNWLSVNGMESDQPLSVQAYFDVSPTEMYQFQLWHDGDLKLTVDNNVLYDGKRGNASQKFVPVALAAGRHRLTLSGRTGTDLKLRILFGGPGAVSLTGKEFRHPR